jgi:hypothetical protein
MAVPPRSTPGWPAATRWQALPLLGVPFAVKNLFDIEGLTTLAGSKIERGKPAGDGRRGAGAAPGRRRRRAAGRAEHGRVRLRLHHREQPRRPDHNPHDLTPHRRWLVGRIGRRGGRRPGAADAGLGHQRLDPRAGVAVRRVRPEAHLRPPAAHRQLPLRGQPGPPGPVRAQRARPGAGLRRDAGPRRRPTRQRVARARSSPPCAPTLQAAPPACASACWAAGSARWRCPRRAPPSTAWPRRWAPRAGRLARGGARRAAAFVITNAESAALHLPDLKTARAGLRAAVARPLPGRRAAARRLGGAGAARAALVCAPGGGQRSPTSTCCSRRPRPAWRPPIGTEWLEIAGQRLPARAQHGAADAAGVVHRPAGVHGAGVGRACQLPIGVQLIAAPWREDRVLAVAAALEAAGVVKAPVAALG